MGFLNREEEIELPESGDLLAVEAIDRTGMLITREGALVRIVHVTPPNPLLLSAGDRERTAAGFCHLVGRLRPDESLQFYVQARPVNTEQMLAFCREQVAEFAGPPPNPGRPDQDPLARSRWRLYGAMEDSVRRHSDQQAAVRTDCYMVVPYLPPQPNARAALAFLRRRGKGLAAAPLERDLDAHRRAVRQSLAHTDALRSELESIGLPTRLLAGEEVAELLWARFNPSVADNRRRRPARLGEVLGELDAPVEAEEAGHAATQLRERIAASALDFGANRHHVAIGEDLEQTLYAATTAEATYMGWLLGAMMTRQPYTLSVHVHALDRSSERKRLKLSYRRVFAVNRGAEAKGRVPDWERYQQEHETERLLQEMAGHERANLYRVSIYQSLRARGPGADRAALSEAVDYCAEQLESSSDVRVSRGEFQQRALWESTLPLARDIAGRRRKYATRNVGDSVPLVGTACGSPRGIPFAFSDPGRGLELIDPFDRSHANSTILVSGRSGSGKTMVSNLLVARFLAHGARSFILDRAGHYRTLTRLVDGARHLDIGSDESEAAINPWDVPDPTEVSLEKVAFLVSLHAVMMGDEGLSALERAQLGAAIRGVYNRAAALRETPRESMLRTELFARAEAEQASGAQDLGSQLRNLAERLGEFCGEGAYAYLLDRETTVNPDAALVVFDTRRCPEAVLKPVMFSLLEYMMRTIERHRDANAALAARPDAPMFAGKSVLVIDEGWHLVGSETGPYMNDIARRARHAGLTLIVGSQQASDFSTEHGVALLRNSTIQLHLSQHPDEIPFMREALGLAEEEAAIISRLKTVKGSHAEALWINGTRGKGRVAICPGPVEYWAFTSDPVRDTPMREQAIARHGGDAWAGILDLAGHASPAEQQRPAVLADAGAGEG